MKNAIQKRVEMERDEVIEQVRAILKVRHPLIRFYVMPDPPKSMKYWFVQWTNGPLESEIKELVAPFARKDLRFRYHRISEPPR